MGQEERRSLKLPRGRISAGGGRSLTEVSDLLVPLDPHAPEPLHHQLYQGLREAITSGRLIPGARVPSTRRLADSLRVSRSTVLVAFDQLVAEGYLVGAVGSGSYVAPELPDQPIPAMREPVPMGLADSGPPRLSARGQLLATFRQRSAVAYPKAFWAGVPPVDEFPRTLWSRLAARRYRSLSQFDLHHGSAAGYTPLREAIAAHLAATRGVRTTPQQVIVVSSAQEALELACRILLDPGDAGWIEDPSWSGARGALFAAGARVVPVPVDADGLVVAEGLAREPGARVAYVSPSHHYPTGVTLSLERRLRLLDWARQQSAWVLEDDYDSEYHFSGRPLTALQGLDTASRVLYIGTFNKTVFPALRLGYLVVPDSLVDPFLAVRGIGGQHAPTIDQAILTDFLVDGHYARHMRRMRIVCRERRDVLVAAAQREAGDLLQIAPGDGGLHAVAWLEATMDDTEASAAAGRAGVRAEAMRNCYAGGIGRPGLVLGYAGFGPHQINAAMRRLAETLRSLPRRGVRYG